MPARSSARSPRSWRPGANGLGGCAPHGAFLERLAAVLALDSLDLVGNSLELAQRVRRHGFVPVRRKRDRLAHLVHGTSTLGSYDAQNGEEVVTGMKRCVVPAAVDRTHVETAARGGSLAR